MNRILIRLKGLVFHRNTRVLIGLLFLGIIASLWWCDKKITETAAPFVSDTTEGLPYNMVGVVLGTSSKVRGGSPNPYFTYRIDAAVELLKAGKVEHLLVSGDNRTLNYNEPFVMQKALIAAGVDSARITLDYAGFRTFDSVVRAKEVFGQRSFTVISQRFHNERAVYIGRKAGLNVVGYNARDVGSNSGWKTRIREKGARVKVFLDLLLGKEPKFLGDPVAID